MGSDTGDVDLAVVEAVIEAHRAPLGGTSARSCATPTRRPTSCRRRTSGCCSPPAPTACRTRRRRVDVARRSTASPSAERDARQTARAPRRPARRERRDLRSTGDLIVRRERDAEVFRALTPRRLTDRDAILLAASGYRTREIASQLGRTWS